MGSHPSQNRQGNSRAEIPDISRASAKRTRAVICASHKHTYSWGGWRQSGCRRRYNGSSMNISAGLFTYSFCRYSRIRWRDRIETGPQPSAMETSSRERMRGEGGREEKEASLHGCWTLRAAPSPWKRARFVERKIYPAIVKRNFRRREKYVLLGEAVLWNRYVNSWVSRMYQQLWLSVLTCGSLEALHCHSCDVMETDKENEQY